MFISRCVEDILRTVFVEYLVHPVGGSDVSDNRRGVYVSPVVLKLEADVVEGSLCLVHEDQLVGAERGDLPHDLASYGAGGAGDEDSLAFEVGTDGFHVDLDRLPHEQVLDVDGLDLAGKFIAGLGI